MGAGNGPQASVLHKQALTPDPGGGTATWGPLTLRSKSSLAESGAGHRGGRRQTPGGRCSWRPRAHRTDQIRDRPGHLLVPRPGPQDGGRWAPRLLCPHPIGTRRFPGQEFQQVGVSVARIAALPCSGGSTGEGLGGPGGRVSSGLRAVPRPDTARTCPGNTGPGTLTTTRR